MKIRKRKLGRERALGLITEGHGEIHIDPRQSPKNQLSTIIHEAIHAAWPEMPENEVLRGERVLLRILWKAGARLIVTEPQEE